MREERFGGVMEQEDFIFHPIRVPGLRKGATIDEKFEAFHDANPHVYQSLRRLALRMRSTGRRKYSIDGLFETLRWEYALRTTGDDFKLNNNFRALYARLLMQKEPALRDFFDLRTRRASLR